MGYLLKGQWTDGNPPAEFAKAGSFERIESIFRERITADGSSGFPAEAGRYHLYVAHNCPWAHRTMIYRALKKLEGAITISHAIPGLREQGWTYEIKSAVSRLPARHGERLSLSARSLHGIEPDLYRQGHGAHAVGQEDPARGEQQILQNIRMLNSEFRGIAGDDTDYYPPELRAEIDRINAFVYANVNNGVYRCGFAKSQAAYDQAFDALFGALDELDARLARQPMLVGDRITEADWRLLPTLLRFDAVYFSLFKCNRQRIADYPNLNRYLHALLRVPGVAGTVNVRYYVMGYYSNTSVNPTGIIPRGTPVDFAAVPQRTAA